MDRKISAPGEIRTPDPQVRSLVLYPTELRARNEIASRLTKKFLNGERGIRTLDGALDPILP